MDKLNELLGQKLFNEVQKRLNGKMLYLSEDYLIPKYRLDELSTQLKSQRKISADLREMLDIQAGKYLDQIAELKKQCLIMRMVANSRPLDFEAVLLLIMHNKISAHNAESSIRYQLKKIKSTCPQLFEDRSKPR